MKCNLFDFNNLAVRIFFSSAVNAKSPRPDYELWRYIVFDNIFKSITKNGGADEVVLAVDNRNPWRKQYWARYKESRKYKRDTSGADWDRFHIELAKLSSDLKHHVPFKVIQIRSAEADDIIAVICMTYPENKYTIISTDEDYLQLYNENTRIYNPLQKKFLEYDHPEEFVIKKCLMGQPKDDILNVKTPLDWSREERKPPLGEQAANKIMSYGYEKWLKENKLEKRFRVNRILIDFNLIPNVIRERVLKEYNEYSYPEPEQIFNFLKENEFGAYIDKFDMVEKKLLNLYK
jgi:hypothetical protein